MVTIGLFAAAVFVLFAVIGTIHGVTKGHPFFVIYTCFGGLSDLFSLFCELIEEMTKS